LPSNTRELLQGLLFNSHWPDRSTTGPAAKSLAVGANHTGQAGPDRVIVIAQHDLLPASLADRSSYIKASRAIWGTPACGLCRRPRWRQCVPCRSSPTTKTQLQAPLQRWWPFSHGTVRPLMRPHCLRRPGSWCVFFLPVSSSHSLLLGFDTTHAKAPSLESSE